MTTIQLLAEASAAPDLRWVFGTAILSGGFFLVIFVIGLTGDMFARGKWCKVTMVIGIIGLAATIITPIVLGIVFAPQGS